MSDRTPTDRETVEELAQECRGQFSIVPYGRGILLDCADTLRALSRERDELRAEVKKLRPITGKADEYRAIANTYAAWVFDMCELLNDMFDELDLNDPKDEALADMLYRAERGIARETRAALKEGNDQ